MLCDKVCQWLAAGPWFSPGFPVSSNKTGHNDIAEIFTIKKLSSKFHDIMKVWWKALTYINNKNEHHIEWWKVWSLWCCTSILFQVKQLKLVFNDIAEILLKVTLNTINQTNILESVIKLKNFKIIFNIRTNRHWLHK
jgi:hypothetical protein